nr:hypothetical protein [Porphyropsis coccinea]
MKSRLSFKPLFLLIFFLVGLNKPAETIKILNLIHFSYTKQNMYAYRIKRDNNVTKKIIIEGINDKYFKNKMFSLFNLDYLEETQKEITKQEINKLLKTLTLSGYFKTVQIKSELLNKIQNISIKCSLMPSLTMVTLQNNKRLVIPQKFIKKVFNKQLNKPQNFQLIHQSIKKIYKWYYDKGFQWVQIHINEQQTPEDSININIFEGQINSVKFKFEDSTKNHKHKNRIKSINLIRDFLNINKGQILNSHQIESQLGELKTKKIFASCDYNVVPSRNNNKELDIIISMYDLSDRTAFLIGRNTSFTTGIIEAIESHILNSINLVFHQSIYKHRIENTTLLNEEENHEHILKNTKCVEINQKYNMNYPLVLNHILTNSQLYDIQDLYEWYTKPLSFNITNNLSTKYNIQNLGTQKDYISLHFEIPNIHNNFTLIYCKPWIYLCKYQNVFLEIQLIKKSFYRKSKTFTDAFNDFFNNNLILSGSLIQTSKIRSKLKIKLSENFILKILVGAERNSYNISYLKKISEFIYNHHLNKTQNNQINSEMFWFNKPNINSNTILHGFSVETRLKYNANSIDDIDWLKEGAYITFISKFFIPLSQIDVQTSQNYTKKFAQRNILQASFFKILYLIEKKKPFNKQCFLYNTEIGHLFGSSTFFPYLEKFELKSPESIRGYTNSISEFPKLFYKQSIEYHLATPNNHSVFLFCDYIYMTHRTNFLFNNELLKLLIITHKEKQYKNKIGFGIGYQLKTSIKSLPPIRIEYAINILNERSIYFRVAQVLSNIAIKPIP